MIRRGKEVDGGLLDGLSRACRGGAGRWHGHRGSGRGLRLLPLVGASADAAAARTRHARADPAQAGRPAGAGRRRRTAGAATGRGAAGHDAGGVGRGAGAQGERFDDVAGAHAARAAAKKKSKHAAEQGRADVKAARDGWFGRFAGVRVDQLVLVDEFGATTDMTRTHGRAPPGERVVARVPHGHWKVVSTIAAMTVKGVVASASFDAATDTELF